MTTRRAFLTGLAGTVICAPAIVRASSLMAVKQYRPDIMALLAQRLQESREQLILGLNYRYYTQPHIAPQTVFWERVGDDIIRNHLPLEHGGCEVFV